MRYDTELTAQLFLRIFEVTTPLSKYLQSSGLDILTAHRMVMATQDAMKNMARDFKSVKQAADTFVQWANAQLMVEEDCELELEAAFPQKRKRKRTMMAGEMASDESLTDANSAYEVEVHNQVMDTITESIHRRFLTHGTLYADLALLDPRNFYQMLCLNLHFKNFTNACSGLTAEQQLSSCSLS